ncbi:serine-threonine protein kinase 19-domain-containing protein [Scenedesmus sp. NREL 46B-D3]|nr:serine-threonine protein kinase 19-domain-containing protein [Scenedesmus sp. NREL 46B-D3]
MLVHGLELGLQRLSSMQRKRSATAQGERPADRVRLAYPSLEPSLADASAPSSLQQQGHQTQPHAAAAATPGAAGIDDDLQLEDLDELPTDAEATVMLLRNQLYPDPAAAAAAALAAKQSRSAKRSRSAPGPSRAAAAAVTAAAAAATAARKLPPIVLKSQLYTVLADKTAVDRDVEQLRQQGRARLFKLAIGADEFVVLLTQDYMRLVDGLIAQHSEAAQQLQLEEQQLARTKQQKQQGNQRQQQQQQVGQHGDEHDDAPGSTTSSAEHAAMAATLQAFRSRVVPVCTESHITSSRLLQLMRTAPAAAHHPQLGKDLAAAPAAAAAAGSADAILRRLLSAELVCRDSRSPDSFMFTVPGAAVFVKSVVAGRQEMLQMLKRKKYQEVLEKELVCASLRGSCLTPAFHLRDLQGRGLVSCMGTTAGQLVRLAQRK